MRTTADYVQMSFLYVLDGFAIVFNVILVYAIATRTPKFMRAYSIFLLNNAIVDILSAIASAMGTIRIVNSHNSQMVFVCLGPCSLVGHWFCHLNHCIHLTLSSQSIVVLFLSFCYRLIIISDTTHVGMMQSRTKIWTACLLSFVPSLAAVYSFYLTGEEPPVGITRELGIDGYVTSWIPHLRDIRAVAPLFYFVVCAPIVMTMIFFVRRRLIAQISTVEASERNQHKRIAQALTYQMLLPSGLALGASIWLLDLMEFSNNELSQRSEMVIVSFFALASPLINLYYLPPYRRFISGKEAGSKVLTPAVMSLH